MEKKTFATFQQQQQKKKKKKKKKNGIKLYEKLCWQGTYILRVKND